MAGDSVKTRIAKDANERMKDALEYQVLSVSIKDIFAEQFGAIGTVVRLRRTSQYHHKRRDQRGRARRVACAV
jgi:hypothetical protein